MRPHRRQPTRLHRPWDSPGKNTAVGCHFLLQCVKVKSESEGARLCSTLRDPMHCSLPGSSVHGFFQARVLEWGATAFSVYQASLLEMLWRSKEIKIWKYLKIYFSKTNMYGDSCWARVWSEFNSLSLKEFLICFRMSAINMIAKQGQMQHSYLSSLWSHNSISLCWWN